MVFCTRQQRMVYIIVSINLSFRCTNNWIGLAQLHVIASRRHARVVQVKLYTHQSCKQYDFVESCASVDLTRSTQTVVICNLCLSSLLIWRCWLLYLLTMGYLRVPALRRIYCTLSSAECGLCCCSVFSITYRRLMSFLVLPGDYHTSCYFQFMFKQPVLP